LRKKTAGGRHHGTAILPGFAHHTSPFAVIEYVVVDEKKRSQASAE